MPEKHSHCGYCGAAFEAEQPWPRRCHSCGETTYRNPLPVAVLLVPVGTGLLVVRRAIPPGEGELAFPGGYINLNESWQEAAVRELLEETNITVPASDVQLFDVHSAPDGTVLIFGVAPQQPDEVLLVFSPNEETQECMVLEEPEDLAFSLHTRAMQTWFLQRI